MVTKEDVDKAKAEWLTAYAAAEAAAEEASRVAYAAAEAAAEEASRVAYAAAEAAAEATTKPAWDKYNALKREFENGN